MHCLYVTGISKLINACPFGKDVYLREVSVNKDLNVKCFDFVSASLMEVFESFCTCTGQML